MKRLQFKKSVLLYMAKEGLTRDQMASELGCSSSTVHKYLTFWGIQALRRKQKTSKPPYQNKRLLQEAYTKVPSVRKLGERWGVSGHLVRHWMLTFGIPVNKNRSTYKKPWSVKSNLKKFYRTLGSKALAKKWNCDPGTIMAWVKRFGLTPRQATGPGVSYSQAYKGKRRLDKSKRPLYPGETKRLKKEAGQCQLCGYKDSLLLLDVHHLDGNRLNNMKANLVVVCVLCHAKETRGVSPLLSKNYWAEK